MEGGIVRKGARLHFVGVGGIGMSGLAQFLSDAGCVVTGSDRAYGQPENDRIFGPLERRGVKIYKQDGSHADHGLPDAIVYSTAIEESNPDFVRAPGVPRLHRSQALKEGMALSGKKMVAVTGSCGKTSVSAWLAETLWLLGLSPSMLSGGAVNRFCRDDLVGNYLPGDGEHFVFEADESDKSLMAYHPDVALILNIGVDHYSEEELLELFGSFTRNVTGGLVIEAAAHEKIKEHIPSGLRVRTFSADPGRKADWNLTGYLTGAEGAIAIVNGGVEIRLPVPGRHNAANAMAVMATLELLGVDPLKATGAISEFKGVWRRFNLAGRNPRGARVYDDYAHNVDKLASCVSAAREVSGGRVFCVFQPHGYGPLGFMKDELFKTLEATLREGDVFAFLPVFYAGGTTSFKPKSSEVADEYRANGSRKYLSFAARDSCQRWLEENTRESDVVLVTGARDNSLSDWASKLIRK